MRRWRLPEGRIRGLPWLLIALAAAASSCTEEHLASDGRSLSAASIRRPTGPPDIPECLPGRWIAALCISEDDCHAWIRLENVETGEVRTVGRYHLLVGGWYDWDDWRWYYPPTFRTGLHMDREQKREFTGDVEDCIVRSAAVTNPRIVPGGSRFGHGLVRHNCVTYARDAWYEMTGEYFDLPPIHTPRALRRAVARAHPEAAR